jgi:hypothetical protein
MKTHVFDEYAAVALVALAAFSLTLFFSGCSQTELSAIQKQEMIAQLGSAKTQDQKNAVESYDPIEAADCRDHAYTAELTIGELDNGYAVSQDELDDALDVPPPSISPAERAKLIKQLKAAKRMDRRFMEIATDDPVSWDGYAERADRIDEVIKDSTIGEDVPWTTIKRAMKVPKNL